VLHSDLKVRNVLLKSDGSSERGCVAKVADFGLAVKLELNHTHVSAFQVRPVICSDQAMLRMWLRTCVEVCLAVAGLS
jgi:serine/threonine protein kinase